MKTLLALALLAVSVSAFSFEQKAVLDFSKLYGNTDAGIYEMKVVFSPKTTVSESTLSFNTHQDDGYFTCTTTANFEVGDMNFTLKDLRNDEVKTFVQKVFAGVSNQVDGSECDTDITKFAGKQIAYAQITPKAPIALNVKAPFDYETVGVYLAPFNGYLNMETEVAVLGNKLVINPGELLTERSLFPLNDQNSSVTYYVFARNGSTTLSLGTGLIKFNR